MGKDTDTHDSLSDLLGSEHSMGTRLGEDNADDLNDDFEEETVEEEEVEDGDLEGKDKSTETPDGSKYSSIEEAVKAAKEAERKMHEATTEAAELRKKLAAQEPPKEEGKKVSPYSDIAKKYAKLIGQIDPKAEDANEQIIALMAEQAAEVAKLDRNLAVKTESERQKVVSKQITYIKAALKKEGLESFENDFYILSRSVPQDGSITNFEDAVSWGIGKIKDLVTRAAKVKQAEEEEEVELEHDVFSMPSGTRKVKVKRGKEKDFIPKTIAESLEALSSARRL